MRAAECVIGGSGALPHVTAVKTMSEVLLIMHCITSLLPKVMFYYNALLLSCVTANTNDSQKDCVKTLVVMMRNGV